MKEIERNNGSKKGRLNEKRRHGRRRKDRKGSGGKVGSK
jgi:hypothetical protein